jgi:DNA-directed RNA polymerase subunit omega
MLNPDLRELLKNNTSRYSLVIAVAKRAREIATDLYEQNMVLPEKPVKTAVEEFACGKYRIVEAEKNK